jgi:hypothetical protein
MLKKSLYLFLTSLLGVLLFLIIHRAAFFIYIYMLGIGVVTTGMTYEQFLAIEYFSLTICLMLGAWYGIWLGLYWFEKVYEEKSHRGFVHHLSTKYFFGSKPEVLESRMARVKEHLEENLWQLEDLAKGAASSQLEVRPRPIKRRAVRKKAPKKLSGV